MFVECAEKVGLLVLVSCGTAKVALGGAEDGSRRKETEPGGSKDVHWEYTCPMPGSKMETPVERRFP